MRGRKPKPTLLKLLSGSRRPINPNEPLPEGDLYAPPADLTEREKEIWRTAIAEAPKGLLRRLDGHLFRLWVEAWATRQEAREMMISAPSSSRLVIKSAKKGVLVKSPYQSIVDQQTRIIRGLTGELGFSPASRSRIALADSEGETRSKAANRWAKCVVAK